MANERVFYGGGSLPLASVSTGKKQWKRLVSLPNHPHTPSPRGTPRNARLYPALPPKGVKDLFFSK